MDLIKQLKEDGTAKGLCRLWQAKLKDGLSTEDLVKLYTQGIDFCISEDFPTLAFIRDQFKGKCEPYGVYVDDLVEAKDLPDVVLNGDCKCLLAYGGFTVARIYARHTSEGAINVADHAVVTIDAFDNTHLAIAVAGDNAQVYVTLYGNAQVETFGSGIVIRKTQKNTY